MTSNIMEQYIKNTKVFINNFTKIFFAENYNEKISNEYIDTYIDARIYNFGETSQRFFYRRIYFSLMEKKIKLEENKELDKSIVEKNLKLYQFIFFIDGVRPITDIDEFITSMYEKRLTKFELDNSRGLKERMSKLIKNYIKEKEEFSKKYETEDFSLNISKYILIDNTYKVDLDYNFKIPYIYSNEVVQEVYNEGIINEDKLIIEYILLTFVCIKDIDKGDFETKYLVDFANTLYEKQNKLKQSLRLIENPAMQDKVYLKIKFSDFESNKEMIYSLMKDGFKFAIIIDNTFSPTVINIKKLAVFEYLIVPSGIKCYEKIKNYETKITNTIIYE